MKDEKKWLLALTLLSLALLLIYVVYSSPPTSLEPGKEIGSTEMKEKIISSPLCIVADIPEEEPSKGRVTNCALEYFQTSMTSFPSKEVEWYGLKGDECQALVLDSCETPPCKGEEYKASRSDCLSKVASKGCYVIYVQEGSSKQSNSYENMLNVFVDESYVEGSCAIRTG